MTVICSGAALQGGTKWPLLGGHNVFKWPYKEVHQVEIQVALQGGTKWPLLGGHNVFKWPYKEVPSGLTRRS